MKMKKIIFSLFVFAFAFLLLGNLLPVHAEGEEVEVTLTAYFDEENQNTTKPSAAYGTKLSVNPILEGYEFAFWIVNGKVKVDYAKNHKFVITDNLDLKAIFKPADKNTHVFLDVNGDVLETQYLTTGEELSEVTLAVIPTKPGHEVVVDGEGKVQWEAVQNINGVFVHVLKYNQTNDDVFQLTISPEANVVTNALEFFYNEIAQVSATAPEGKVFSHWTVNNVIVSYKNSYSFTMLEDTEIVAHFADVTPEAKALVILKAFPDLKEGKNSFLGQFEIPAGYEVVEYGMLKSTVPGEIKIDDANVTKYQSNILYNETSEWMVSFAKVGSENVRAYLVVKDAEGARHTVYSKPVLETPSYVYAEDLFFSYYIEGSSNNKAIAIFNGTGDEIDLSNYTLEQYGNGNTAATVLSIPQFFLGHGEVYIIAHSSANESIKAIANQTSSTVVNFNGDDALVLKNNGEIIDSFGKIGSTDWKLKGYTEDMSVKRSPSVTSGRKNATSDFDPSLEWVKLSLDSIEGIKNHVITNLGPAAGLDDLIASTKVELDSLYSSFNLADYSLASKAELNQKYNNAITAIENATSSSVVRAALATAEGQFNAVKTLIQEYHAEKDLLVLPTGEVAADLDLHAPTKSYITYVWNFSPTGIINHETGEFTAPTEDTLVTVSVEIHIDGVKVGEAVTSTFTAKKIMSEQELINAASDDLDSKKPTLEVSSNLTLPSAHPIYLNVTYTWISSNEAVLTSSGVYIGGSEDVLVTLTAKVLIDGIEKHEITYNVTVKAKIQFETKTYNFSKSGAGSGTQFVKLPEWNYTGVSQYTFGGTAFRANNNALTTTENFGIISGKINFTIKAGGNGGTQIMTIRALSGSNVVEEKAITCKSITNETTGLALADQSVTFDNVNNNITGFEIIMVTKTVNTILYKVVIASA